MAARFGSDDDLVGDDVGRPAAVHRTNVRRRFGVQPSQPHPGSRSGEYFDGRNSPFGSHSRMSGDAVNLDIEAIRARRAINHVIQLFAV